MTKPKPSYIGERLARGSVTHLLSTTLRELSVNPGAALYHFPNDAELARYVAAGDVPMIAARLVELTLKNVPQQAAASNAQQHRSEAAAEKNRETAATKRAATLRAYERNLAAGYAPREAISKLGGTKGHRDHVRQLAAKARRTK